MKEIEKQVRRDFGIALLAVLAALAINAAFFGWMHYTYA